MTTTDYELPNISVDVVPLTVNKITNQLEVFVGRRIYEPYLGEYALPGVLLSPHERLNEAAERALSQKTSIASESVVEIFDLGTFDNPDRDPRGATVSIAKLAIIADVPADTTSVKRIPVDSIANDSIVLPFDHNEIVRQAVNLFGEKFLASKTFSKAVLGQTFTTKTVRGVLTQISEISSDTDHNYDPSNLTRQLKSTGWVQVLNATPAEELYDTLTSTQSFAASTVTAASVNAYSSQRGRPSRVWSWN